MSAVVADTHSLLWYLNNSPLLYTPARTAFENAEQTGQPIYVPSIVIVEMRYLVEKGTISEAGYQIGGQRTRISQATGEGEPFVSDVKCGAVIHGGAHNRQPQCHIYASFKIQ